MKRKICFCFFILIFFSNLFAEKLKENVTEKSWHLLESSKIAIEKGEFGKALLLVGKAAEIHKENSTYRYEYLYRALRPKQIQKARDNIFEVYKILEIREDVDACKILDEIFLTHPPAFFNKSAEKLLIWLKERAAFPEGDYIMGKIYFAQGEYLQALSYFEKSWNNKDFLDVPEERFNIIYSIADTAKILGKHDMQEKYLLLVLTEDAAFGSTMEESPALKAMLNTISKEKNTDKFFMLYRNKNHTALKAYKDLTEIYLKAGSTRRALSTAALAANISLTALSDALQKEDFSYKYSDIQDVFIRCGKNNGILHWAEKKELWAIFVNFADAMYANGLKTQSADLYYKIAESIPSIDYAQRALYKLTSKK